MFAVVPLPKFHLTESGCTFVVATKRVVKGIQALVISALNEIVICNRIAKSIKNLRPI